MMKPITFLVAALLLGMAGCKSGQPPGLSEERTDDTQAAIRKHIGDPTKAASMLAVVDAFKGDVSVIESAIMQVRSEIVTASADYTTERKALEALYDQLGEQVRLLGNTFRDRNFELKELCSSDEWKSIADDDATLVTFKF